VRLRRSAGTNTAREHSLWRCDAAVGAPQGCQRQPRPEAQAPAPANASMRPNTIEASIVDKVHGERMWITPGQIRIVHNVEGFITGNFWAAPVNKMPRCHWTRRDEDDSSSLLPPRYIPPGHIVAMIGSAGWGSTSAPAWLGSAHLRRGVCAEPPARVVEGRSLLSRNA